MPDVVSDYIGAVCVVRQQLEPTETTTPNVDPSTVSSTVSATVQPPVSPTSSREVQDEGEVSYTRVVIIVVSVIVVIVILTGAVVFCLRRIGLICANQRTI